MALTDLGVWICASKICLWMAMPFDIINTSEVMPLGAARGLINELGISSIHPYIHIVALTESVEDKV